MQIVLIIILCLVIGFLYAKSNKSSVGSVSVGSVKVYPKCTECKWCEVSDTGWADCNAPQNFVKSFDGNMVVGKTETLKHRCSSCNQARLGIGEVSDSNTPIMRCKPVGKWFEPRGPEDPPLLPLKRHRQTDCTERHWNTEED